MTMMTIVKSKLCQSIHSKLINEIHGSLKDELKRGMELIDGTVNQLAQAKWILTNVEKTLAGYQDNCPVCSSASAIPAVPPVPMAVPAINNKRERGVAAPPVVVKRAASNSSSSCSTCSSSANSSLLSLNEKSSSVKKKIVAKKKSSGKGGRRQRGGGSKTNKRKVHNHSAQKNGGSSVRSNNNRSKSSSSQVVAMATSTSSSPLIRAAGNKGLASRKFLAAAEFSRYKSGQVPPEEIYEPEHFKLLARRFVRIVLRDCRGRRDKGAAQAASGRLGGSAVVSGRAGGGSAVSGRAGTAASARAGGREAGVSEEAEEKSSAVEKKVIVVNRPGPGSRKAVMAAAAVSDRAAAAVSDRAASISDRAAAISDRTTAKKRPGPASRKAAFVVEEAVVNNSDSEDELLKRPAAAVEKPDLKRKFEQLLMLKNDQGAPDDSDRLAEDDRPAKTQEDNSDRPAVADGGPIAQPLSKKPRIGPKSRVPKQAPEPAATASTTLKNADSIKKKLLESFRQFQASNVDAANAEEAAEPATTAEDSVDDFLKEMLDGGGGSSSSSRDWKKALNTLRVLGDENKNVVAFDSNTNLEIKRILALSSPSNIEEDSRVVIDDDDENEEEEEENDWVLQHYYLIAKEGSSLRLMRYEGRMEDKPYFTAMDLNKLTREQCDLLSNLGND